MNGRRAGAGLVVGFALVMGPGAGLALAGPAQGARPTREVLRPRIVICYCPDAVLAHFHVERYQPSTRTWVGVPDVPVSVEVRTPGNPSPAGWSPEQLAGHRSWSSIRTGPDGAGRVRLVTHPHTLEYRLRLPDGSRSAAVQPSCD